MTQENIIQYFKTHTALNKSAVCRDNNIDPANLHRYLNGENTIGTQKLESLITYLKHYGFDQIDTNERYQDNNNKP